jgi:broad specificity phosphatase PhoE
MTALAFLRHADTAWSVAGRIQGRADVPLLPGASCQLPARCRGMRVVTSPLLRCVQTAQLLGAADAEREPRLIEMHWGEWEGETLARLREDPSMLENEARGFDFTPPGGECPRDVLSRVLPWLRHVAHDGRPTLAITHRGVIRVVLAQACGWDMRGLPPEKLAWHAAHIFKLDAEGNPSIDCLNVR